MTMNRRTKIVMKEIEKMIKQRKRIHSREITRIRDDLCIANETMKKIIKILQNQRKITIKPDLLDTRCFYIICAEKEKIGVCIHK